MDRFRLKNIIILILVLVNVFLLASLGLRKSAEQTARRDAAEQLAALFAADGITLDSDAIPQKAPPQARTLTRDTALDRRAALYLLGEPLSDADQGGGIYTYSGGSGAALFRMNGSFDAAGPLSTDPESFCRKFCREFLYDDPIFLLDETDSGTASAVRMCDGLPVYNCTVVFTLENGAVTGVNGTLLPDSHADTVTDTQPLSASAALTAFLQAVRRETSAAVTAVTDLYLCYELQSSSAALSLVPAWCVVTDTANYYVNCFTGAVTQG